MVLEGKVEHNVVGNMFIFGCNLMYPFDGFMFQHIVIYYIDHSTISDMMNMK